MPKKFLSVLLVVIFVLPIFFQATSVTAQVAPITSPITNPVTFFNLTGKITYKRLGGFFRGATRITPAANVAVKIRGFFSSNKKYTTQTNADGDYMINLPPGMYLVEADDSSHTFFVPPFKATRVKANIVNKTNFQGLVFP